MDQVRVSNQELRTIRDAMRDLNHMVERLERGEIDKFVLTQRNQMRAVLLPIRRYGEIEQILSEATDGHATQPAAG